MRWDGTDVKAHVKVTGKTNPGATSPMNASLIMMAPQGDQALAQVVNDFYLVTVPYVGGDTPSSLWGVTILSLTLGGMGTPVQS